MVKGKLCSVEKCCRLAFPAGRSRPAFAGLAGSWCAPCPGGCALSSLARWAPQPLTSVRPLPRRLLVCVSLLDSCPGRRRHQCPVEKKLGLEESRPFGDNHGAQGLEPQAVPVIRWGVWPPLCVSGCGDTSLSRAPVGAEEGAPARSAAPEFALSALSQVSDR